MYRKPARVPRQGHGCLREPALLRPAPLRAITPRLRGLVRGTHGTGLGVRPAAGGRLGAGAPDRLFGEVHLDTFADGMGHVLQHKREEGRVSDGGKTREKGKPGWDGNKATRKQGTSKKGCVSWLGGGSYRVSPPLAFAAPPFLPHPPPPRSPSPSPANATATAGVRTGTVYDRQRGLSGSWPPGPQPPWLSRAPKRP